MKRRMDWPLLIALAVIAVGAIGMVIVSHWLFGFVAGMGWRAGA